MICTICGSLNHRAASCPKRPLKAVLILLATLLGPMPSHAHSWYPISCCSGQDCKRVDKIEPMEDGSMRMEVGAITVVVPRGFALQPSQDGDAHICIYAGREGQYLPRCVFMPAGV